jgi:hypothetical protein
MALFGPGYKLHRREAVETRMVRLSHIVGQFGSFVKVYSFI